MLHTIVMSIDAFGFQRSWIATDSPVVVDVTSLPLPVSTTPAKGPAHLQTTLHIETCAGRRERPHSSRQIR